MAPEMGNRFLFVVDTSAGMEHHALEARQLIVDLLASRANGQLHPGDTLGLWTFNAEIYTGGLPVQRWVQGKEWQVAANMADYLQQQHYGKRSRLDRALPAMFEIIKNSDVITIILISDGEGKMQGTPFDAEINSAYKRCLAESKKGHMPVVTVLLANAGKITKYTVNALPWPVVFPEVPVAPKPPPTVPQPSTNTAPATQPAAPHPAILPPLILEGPSVRSKEKNPTAAPSIPDQGVNVLPQPTPAATVRPTAKPETLPTAVAGAPPSQVPDPTPTVQSSEPAISVTNLAAISPTPPPGTPPVAPAHTTVAESLPARAPDSPTVQAVVMPPDDGHRPSLFLVAGLALVLCAIGLVSWMVRRARTSGPSLITSSMNRRK